MLNQIISFVERDVDGCRTDVEVMVLLRANFPLTNGHKTRLEEVIEEIRNEWEDDEWDTDSVVEEALARVFGTDVEWETVIPDIDVEF